MSFELDNLKKILTEFLKSDQRVFFKNKENYADENFFCVSLKNTKYFMFVSKNINAKEIILFKSICENTLHMAKQNENQKKQNQEIGKDLSQLINLDKYALDDETKIGHAFISMKNLNYIITNDNNIVFNSGVLRQEYLSYLKLLDLKNEFIKILSKRKVYGIKVANYKGVFIKITDFTTSQKAMLKLKLSWLLKLNIIRKTTKKHMLFQKDSIKKLRSLQNQIEQKSQEKEKISKELDKIENHLNVALKKAFQDELTSIYNRNKANELLNEFIEKNKKKSFCFSLIMFDIDNFKLINDTYGHPKGDKVLVKCVDLVNKNLRSNDILARWGGDEFIVLLPKSNLNRALKCAKRLCFNINNLIVINKVKLSCSFGVAQFSNEKNLDDLIEKVDKALYKAKKKGGNNFCSY